MLKRLRLTRIENLFARAVLFGLAFSIVTGLLFFLLFSHQPLDILRRVAPCQPLVIHEDREYLSELSDVQVSGNHVYLLYEDIHLLEVYDTTGAFVSAFAMVEERDRRGSHMEMSDEGAFVFANNDLYVFCGNQFVRYDDEPDYKALWDITKKNRYDSEGRRYYLRGASVWRENADGRREVFVHRNPLLVMCSFVFSWTTAAVSILLGCVGIKLFPWLSKRIASSRKSNL